MRILSLFIVVVTIYGCGYTELAKYSKETLGTPPGILSGSKENHSIRIVVRYPAIRDEDAYTRIEKSVQLYHKWDRVACAVEGHSSLTLSKSAYYAALFSSQLREKFPSAYVVMQPMLIDIGTNKEAFWVNESSNNLTPTVLVDFLAYVDQCRPVTNIKSTAGRYLNPHLTVRVSPSYSPQTNGLVASTVGSLHVTGKRESGGSGAYSADGGTFVDTLNLPFWRDSELFLFDQPSLWEKQKIRIRPWRKNQALLVRDSRIELIPDYSESFDPLKLSENQIMFWSGVIGDAAQLVDQDKGVFLEQYANLIGISSQYYRERQSQYYDVLEAAYSVESKFLEHVSILFEASILSGEFGSNFRAIRDEEESGKSFASQMSMILSASLVAHSNGLSNSYSGAIVASQALEQKQSAYSAKFTLAALPQIVVSGKFLGKSYELPASSISELRKKLSSLIERRVMVR